MKHLYRAASALIATLALAACSQKAETEAPAPTEAAATPEAPPTADNMAAAGAKMAKGVGTVTKIDTATGVITVDHDPIPEAEWPAMVMGFKSTPALAQTVKVGDKIAFDLKLEDGGGEITAIQKR